MNRIIRRLLVEFDDQIVGILESTVILSSKGRLASAWPLLSRSSRRPMAVRKATELLVGRGIELNSWLRRKPARAPRLARLASQFSAPLVGSTDINGPEARKVVTQWSVDLLVSVSMNQRIGAELVALPPRGVINVHGAFLPRYRGLFPYFWVLANGDEKTGSTVHWVDAELDTGPILLQKEFPIEPHHTVISLAADVADLGAELTVEAIRLIEQDRAPRVPQNSSLASYYSWPAPADFRRLRHLGRRYGSITEMWRALS